MIDYPISLQVVAPRAMAAVHACLAVDRVPALFSSYLNQVYSLARANAIALDGQNIFVYRDCAREGEAEIDFGVGVTRPFTPIGPLEYLPLPVGEAVMTTHWRDYALGGAHDALVAWCKANNRRRTGTRWEVYGHWSDDPAKVRTDVYHQLEPMAPEG